VTEEAVLSDNSGLQIGGGPVCLFYSRATQINDPEYTVMPWDWAAKHKVTPCIDEGTLLFADILDFIGALQNCNDELRSQLSPEVAAELQANELVTEKPGEEVGESQMSVS
jgi:hypothetical protein